MFNLFNRNINFKNLNEKDLIFLIKEERKNIKKLEREIKLNNKINDYNNSICGVRLYNKDPFILGKVSSFTKRNRKFFFCLYSDLIKKRLNQHIHNINLFNRLKKIKFKS